MRYPRFTCVLAFALATAAAGAGAQTLADLRNDATTTGDVTTYGMGWAQQRYSPLKQINAGNVKRLVPVWNLSLDNSANASSQPLVIDGTMYVATHTHTVAVDAVTGRQKWKTPVEAAGRRQRLPVLRHPEPRGMAALDGVLYRTTIDAQVVAHQRWPTARRSGRSKAADYKHGYSMTHAPLIAGGVLITGISGGEYGTRGFLDGWDLKTGEKKWHRWTTAAPGEKGGDTWKPGMRYETGGAPDLADRHLRPRTRPRVLGHRQRRAVERRRRAAAIRSTSARCWRCARRPARSSGTTSSRPATRTTTTAPTNWCWPSCRSGGKPTKVLMQANRNGFFYVLDRTNGKLLSATQFARKVNWASGIDMATGRPIDTPMTTDGAQDRADDRLHRGLAERLRRQELDADELRPERARWRTSTPSTWA